MPFKIEPPYFPIVYVRGFAMTEAEREETFYDAFYGFAKTAVSPHKARPQDNYLKVDVFEGQLLRLMKEHKYIDAANAGLAIASPGQNPSRSVWVCRFYDDDVLGKSVRDIVDHATDLKNLVTEVIPAQLESAGVNLGAGRKDYRVILMAHSMGGLVCRTFIQNLVRGQADRWVEKLVTIGTPHGGIELEAVPDPILRLVQRTLNPGNSKIFDPRYMRKYLKIKGKDVRALEGTFDPKRCLCVVGSDYRSYGSVQHATGSYSDGLVKQDNAFILEAHRAHVHHPHSGTTGIVNSYESYENIQRFLFGNTRVTLKLADVKINTERKSGVDYFYDFECLIAIRNTGVYVHRREADPCENSIRRMRDKIENPLLLHIGFLNTNLKPIGADHSHFALLLRVKESAVEKGMFWDKEYPDIAIFQQTIEFRIGDFDPDEEGFEVQYRWREHVVKEDWKELPPDDEDRYVLNLAKAGRSPAFAGKLVIQAERWNDWF